MAMTDGIVKGQFVFGQNPIVGAVNSDLVARGLAKLEWLVVRDFALTETANFWKDSRIHETGELRGEDIATEVFFLPTALPGEKDGTVTQHQPPGAMARQGLRGARRQPRRLVVRLSSRTPPEAALRRQHRAGATAPSRTSRGTIRPPVRKRSPRPKPC